MTNAHAKFGRMVATITAVCAVTVLAGACKSDSTAPAVATSLSADAASNAQVGTVGQPLAKPVVVHVTDQNDNPLANATVSWTVMTGAGTTSAPTSITDASGSASVTWTLDTLARTDSLKASVASGTSIYLTATGQAAAASSERKMSGDAQTVVSGSTSQAMVVMVTDRYGNPVQGATVTWLVVGGGTLGALSTTTDATGQAQTTLATAGTPGIYTVTATAGLSLVASFTVTGN